MPMGLGVAVAPQIVIPIGGILTTEVTEVTELRSEKEKGINRKQNKIGKLLFLM